MMELDGHGYPTGKKLGLFENKTICVFGGTGSIGTLIVEYLLDKKPYSIRIFSNVENELYESRKKWGNSNMRYLLGDIRDIERVKRALNGVDYAFNSAAVKHVPFAEYNPLEAVQTNIIGLNNIIEGCIYHKVKKFLHISTDKACEPTTVMGASKLIGERLVQMRWAQNPEIQMIVVRLGNVWGSRGSLVPFIEECKKQNKPMKITDMDMTRYFMKPNEVTDFIFDAFENGHDGEIWVPKLKVVKIIDVIHGLNGVEYPYEIIGRRKGEKLNEKLISEEELSRADELEDKWVIKNEIWQMV